MPPKTPKRKPGSDIRKWCAPTPPRSSTPPGGAAASQKPESFSFRGKEESTGGPVGGHSHNFKVQFDPDGQQKFNIHCDRPQTVLDAIKSLEASTKKLKDDDNNLIIQLSSKDQQVIVATHFPCSCIDMDEIVIVYQQKHQVEEAGVQWKPPVLPKDEYSVFYIDTKGGLNTASKKLFRNSKIKDFRSVCVYAKRGMTVEEAVRRDGRFIAELPDFTLTNVQDKNLVEERSQTVDGLHGKQLKLCLPKNTTKRWRSAEVKVAIALAEQQGVSVYPRESTNTNAEPNLEEIYEILRRQFPDLREWMEKVFTAKYYQTEMQKKENFGKIQKSFSEVYRLKKLFGLAQSVCKIVVEGVCTGSGFVLVDNFIMTAAHLFSRHVTEQTLDANIKVCAYFHYDQLDREADYVYFTAENKLVEWNRDLDYAVLELRPEGQRCKRRSKKSTNVPPGLLERFGPIPPSGEVCLFGHPNGEVKQMDPTWIIEKENRGKAVDEHLPWHMRTMFNLLSLRYHLSVKGIENILKDGSQADQQVTYNTFMYHGSSGSPVFDGLGRLCGLHTSGFTYGFTGENHVMECGQSLLTIFQDLVGKLRTSGKDQLLDRIKEESKKNSDLENIFSRDDQEPMDQS